MEDLEPLVGTWRIGGDNPVDPSEPLVAEVSFEWLSGGRWLVQRWSSDVEVFPDGIAVLGEVDGGGLMQHYFDSRGVARVYGTSLATSTARR